MYWRSWKENGRNLITPMNSITIVCLISVFLVHPDQGQGHRHTHLTVVAVDRLLVQGIILHPASFNMDD
jgi:uncharacterized membrane protein